MKGANHQRDIELMTKPKLWATLMQEGEFREILGLNKIPSVEFRRISLSFEIFLDEQIRPAVLLNDSCHSIDIV